MNSRKPFDAEFVVIDGGVDELLKFSRRASASSVFSDLSAFS